MKTVFSLPHIGIRFLLGVSFVQHVLYHLLHVLPHLYEIPISEIPVLFDVSVFSKVVIITP